MTMTEPQKNHTKRLTGSIKWYNADKGYGFIVSKDVDKDIFVHFSAVEGHGYRFLEEGEAVSFELEENQHGTQAKKVRKVPSGQRGEALPALPD